MKEVAEDEVGCHNKGGCEKLNCEIVVATHKDADFFVLVQYHTVAPRTAPEPRVFLGAGTTERHWGYLAYKFLLRSLRS